MPVRGATWQVRLVSGGPTGIVGPWLYRGGGDGIDMAHAFPYLTAKSPDISSVWDYVPTRFLFCR